MLSLKVPAMKMPTRNYYQSLRVVVSIVILILLSEKATSSSPFPPETSKLNLLVAVHDSVPHDLIKTNNDFIDNIERLIGETSQSLFTASGNNLYLDSVTLLLPSTWRNYYIGNSENATYETFEDADIQIDEPQPGRNDVPYTIRSEGCGKPGRKIYLPTNFIVKSITENDFTTNAKLLLRELAFYQFGVFDECGYKSNVQYPPIYYGNDYFQPTGCMSGNLNGTVPEECTNSLYVGFRDSKCDIHLNSNRVKQPSLTYQPTWKKATLFCDKNSHNAKAPTKQNNHCHGKSVMEVIKSNPKYANLSPISYAQPNIKVVFKSEANYIILLDESISMQTNHKFETVNLALRYMITNDFPTGASVGLATISSVFNKSRSITKITHGALRQHMLNGLPDNPQLAPETNIEKGILGSAEMLMTRTRGNIILLTAGKWTPPNVDHLCDKLVSIKIRLTTIFCPDSQQDVDQQTLDALQQLTSCSYGKVYVIPEISNDNEPVLYERLKSVLRESLQPDDFKRQNIDIQEKSYNNSAQSLLTGDFLVDNSIDINTQSTFRVTHHKVKNVQSVVLKHEDGTIYNNEKSEFSKTSMSVAYQFNMQPGLWTYEIKLYDQYKEWPLIATASSEVIARNTITVTVWTNANKPIDAVKTPIIVYAEIKQGSKIVTNARAKAIIYSPDDESKIYELELFDDGNGDPDITKNDGIYSRYFTKPTTPGYYALYVHVIGLVNESMPKTQVLEETPLTSEPSNNTVCSEKSYRGTETGKFERFAVGSSFYVQFAITNENYYPPNKITDLRLTKISPSERIVELQWTAPGQNYDHGTVSKYEVRYSLTRSHLQEDQYSSKALLKNLQIPTFPARTSTSARIQLPKTNDHFYIAMQTSNAEHKKSPVSNIVSIHFPPPGTVVREDDDTIFNNGTAGNPQPESKTANIGVIIAIVVGILVLLIIIVVVYRIVRNRTYQRNTYPVAEKEKKFGSRDNLDETVEVTPLRENTDDLPEKDSAV